MISAAVITAFVSAVMMLAVMLAFCVGIKSKVAGQIILHRRVGLALYPGV